MTETDLFDVRRRCVPAKTTKKAKTKATAPPKPIRSSTADFDEFWRLFPRRVGKLAALKAYKTARKIADAKALIDGIERYKRAKPDYADWCHPATFLNQGRWMDEAPAPERRADEWVCQHAPRCGNSWRCDQLIKIAAEKAK